MTTLAIKGNTFASDSLLTLDTNAYALVDKLKRMPDGSVLGVCGDFPGCTSLLDFVYDKIATNEKIDYNDLAPFKNTVALHLTRDGVFLLEGGAKRGIVKLQGEFFTEGSGYAAALAALHAGVSVVRAVEIACMIDTKSRLPVQTMELEL